MTTIFLPAPAACSDCGFSTADLNLLARHSCAVQEQGGQCEDFPCCGHERGDCNGLLYGSDESIQANEHLLCDHSIGDCEVAMREAEEAEDAEYDYLTQQTYLEHDMI